MADERNNRRYIRERKRKIRRWTRILLTVFFLALAGIGSYLIVTEFSVSSIEVEGNVTYSTDEIVNAMKKEDYVPNTLAMVIQNRIFRHTYLPFVETVHMEIRDNHVLVIKVKEKLRAGVFEYMKRYFYFNEQGVAMESRKTLFENVPVITGVKFREVKPKEKIRVEGNYYNTIVLLTKKIIAYRLQVSEIHFDGEDDVTIVSGKYRIYLGPMTCLDGKLSRVKSEIEAVSEVADEGVIDMHLFTDEKEFVTFRKTKDSTKKKKK
ncbi:MAG: hypothetical protein IJH71_03525 [Eubacterium sp.]|nr:hypothetical protein [Eubacterium sp.]